MEIELQIKTEKGDETIKGNLIEIINSKEQWSEYELEDGNILKVKHVAVKIIDVNKKNPDGTKIYATQFQPIFNIIEKTK